MYRYRAWGLSAALAVGAGAPAAAADPPDPARPPGTPTTLYNKLFGPSKPKDRPANPGRPTTVPSPLPAEVVANALQAEQEAWDRRMTVCLKLRQVALDKNDEALMRQVDDLERQATAVYAARVTALGVKGKPAPLPTEAKTTAALKTPGAEPDGGSSPGDVRAAARRLSAPDAPAPLDTAVRTAEARTPGDVIREVGP